MLWIFLYYLYDIRKKVQGTKIRPAFISCLSALKLPLHAVKFAK